MDFWEERGFTDAFSGNEISTEPPTPLSTFAYTPSRSSEIIATGPGSNLFVVNVNRGSIIRQVGIWWKLSLQPETY